MKAYFNSFLDVPTSDPDDARRRRLLNILLLGTIFAAIAGLAFIILDRLTTQAASQAEFQLLLAGTVLITLGIIGIYQINRRVSGRLAALLFLLLLTGIFSFTDSPEELSNGRSLFLFTIPIAISSLILLPQASFLFAALSSGIIAFLSFSIDKNLNNVNIFAIIGFFMLALVSWLSARSLESALKDLRVINANLDQVVIERTKALAESLDRERIEAGRNRAILNSIADGVIVFDRKWNAILANPAIRGMIELPVELIINKNFRDLIEHPSITPNSRGYLHAMIDQDTQPIGFRVEWGGKTLSLSAAQVYNTKSENIGTVVVFRDFTREAEVENLKSTFVAIVSHELRTPLSAILGYAEMFKESIYGPVNEKQVNMADRIIINTQRLLGLLNDLLDQAQMEAGRMAIQMGPVRLADLLDNLHGLLDKTASDKNLRLTSEIDDSLPETLQSDPARLQQILVNLVTNAIKFTDRGAVSVRMLYQTENKWGIEVSDTGRGIPKSEIPYIFDTFHQVEGAAIRTQGGFGLGLSIVKQLVNLMSGEIKVHSEPEKGTTFNVTLPLVVSETITNWRTP